MSIILRTVPGTCLIAGSRDYFLESLTLKCERSAFPNYNIYCQLSIWRVTNWIIMIWSKYFKFHKAGDMFISIIFKILQFFYNNLCNNGLFIFNNFYISISDDVNIEKRFWRCDVINVCTRYLYIPSILSVSILIC